MTSPVEPSRPGADSPRPGLLSILAKYHQEIGYGLFGLAALFAILPVYLLIQHGWPGAMGPLFTWGVLTATASLIAAVASVTRSPDAKLSEVDKVRLLLLALGGTLGLLTALLGLTLPFFLPYSAVFAGGVAEWRKNPGVVFGVAAAVVGGLALTFASLQVARGQERESALMRRLLYGFNAVFSSLLLAAILLLVNLLPYNVQMGPNDFLHKFFTSTFDWTQARIYSLSDRSKNTLSDLKEPVKVYVLMDASDPLTEQVETLLENCRAVNPRFSWQAVSSLAVDQVQKLFEDYKGIISDSRGLVVVYGEKPHENAQFLSRKSLFKAEQQGDEDRVSFQGEGVLFKTVRGLQDKKSVVYFTQGDEELDFAGGQEDSTDAMNILVEFLRRREIYELKELNLNENAAVPDDADVVVVARPDKLKAGALKAIYTYMGYAYDDASKTVQDLPKGRKGKLVALMDVQTRDKKMVETGLEPLLAKFSVSLGNDHILTLKDLSRPTELEVETDRRSGNPIAKAFGPPNRTTFHFNDVRTVKPLSGPGGSAFTVDGLLVNASEPAWVETDLSGRASELAAAKSKQGDAKFSDEPIGVAVAVSESKSPDMPNDFNHANLSRENLPRMVVFGDAGWISNHGLLGYNDGEAKYSLFTSCLAWLRERSDLGATPVEADETKSRVVYQPPLSEDAAWNMQFLPLGHLILAVIAGGVGVWLVRRR
jgi:ABC-type uncharacterized transport system